MMANPPELPPAPTAATGATTSTATLRLASSFLPDDPDPRSAIAWPNIQLCMQLFDRLVEEEKEHLGRMAALLDKRL